MKARNMLRAIRNLLPNDIQYFIDYSRVKKRIPIIGFEKEYSDYIFWDNLLDRHSKHAYLADKYKVRDFVKERGLESSLTKLYGVWDDAKKIDFDTLPNQFALKCNHSCGMNIICSDKNSLNKENTIKQLNEWLNSKHPIYYEKHYKKIKPLIICEEYLSDSNGNFPYDYKIHCAGGKPIYIQCCFERTQDSPGKRAIYSLEWENLHFVKPDSSYSSLEIDKPKGLNEMIRQASILSAGLDYARIDFYDLDGRIIFGEITLSPMGGWLSYFTDEAQKMMANAIKISKKKNV